MSVIENLLQKLFVILKIEIVALLADLVLQGERDTAIFLIEIQGCIVLIFVFDID